MKSTRSTRRKRKPDPEAWLVDHGWETHHENPHLDTKFLTHLASGDIHFPEAGLHVLHEPFLQE